MTSPEEDFRKRQKANCHERVKNMTEAKANEMVDRTLGILRNCAVPKDYFKDIEKMIEHFEFLRNGNTVYVERD